MSHRTYSEELDMTEYDQISKEWYKDADKLHGKLGKRTIRKYGCAICAVASVIDYFEENGDGDYTPKTLINEFSVRTIYPSMCWADVAEEYGLKAKVKWGDFDDLKDDIFEEIYEEERPVIVCLEGKDGDDDTMHFVVANEFRGTLPVYESVSGKRRPDTGAIESDMIKVLDSANRGRDLEELLDCERYNRVTKIIMFK